MSANNVRLGRLYQERGVPIRYFFNQVTPSGSAGTALFCKLSRESSLRDFGNASCPFLYMTASADWTTQLCIQLLSPTCA